MPRPTDYRNPETNMHGTFKVYNYPIPKADPRFPVRTENTRGTRRQRIRRAKREAVVFSDVRTVRKNVSPADSARRTQTPEGRSRTAGHTQPKGWRSPAAGRNDDNGPPCTAGRIRQERQGTRPTETKTDQHTTGIRKSGYSMSPQTRIVEYPDL